MKRLTPEDIDQYLATNPDIERVNTIIELLQEYVTGVEYAIQAWVELVPDNWGDNDRHIQLKEIITFLKRLGFDFDFPKLDSEIPEFCTWELTKGKDTARLHWGPTTKSYFVGGMRHPRDEQDDPIALPSCLSWV